MSSTLVAGVLPLVLLAYLVLIDWVPLRRWNDRAARATRDHMTASAMSYGPLLVISYASFHGSRPGTSLALLLSALYLAGHIRFWWIPYFFGASAEHREQHEWFYSRTLKFWPPIGDHPIPDAQHTIVGALTLLMIAGALVHALQAFGLIR